MNSTYPLILLLLLYTDILGKKQLLKAIQVEKI